MHFLLVLILLSPASVPYRKKLLYTFPVSHLVICCCCCRMSVQTAGQEWQCPGAGSQNWLSGCQRERAVSQVVPPVDRPAGGVRKAGEGARLGSSHTASLNWCFQSRNVSSFGTCFVCLCFPTHIPTPQRVISLFLHGECKNIHAHIRSMAAAAIST